MPINPPDALYRLLSWLSPNYPVGAFSYSHGLEAAVEQGSVRDVASLTAWVETVLEHGTGQVDGTLFCEAWRATDAQEWGRLQDVRALGNAFLSTGEFALEARAQGDAFLRATSAAWHADALDRLGGSAVYAVAVAVACAAHGVPMDSGLHAYLHAFAANLVSAGVRLIPLGQTDGQRALAALSDTVSRVRERAAAASPDDLGTSAPLLDLASMQHETQYTRLFRS